MTSSNIYPVFQYADANKALRWLSEAFGFEQIMAVPGENGTIAHAQMRLGTGMIMFSSAREELAPADPHRYTIYVAVPDIDEHCARARAAGAEIVMEPTDMDYGSRDYFARDFEGNNWAFGTYAPQPG